MKILHVEIHTDDLPQTEEFYSNRLGLRIITRQEDQITFQAGESTLTFLSSPTIAPKYHLAFNIPANKLDEAIEWISPRTSLIPVVGKELIAHFDNWNAKSVYFLDNKGNILEFIVRFDLNNPSGKPFDSSSILSLNEIGIVTDHPLVLADSLVQDYGLVYYWRGPKREDFVAVGDDDGLFIIAITKRNWYPTDLPSEKQYVRITFSIHGICRKITVNDR